MDGFKVSANDFVTEKTCRISDHYEVKAVLGEGSYGSVRKITHKLTGEDRAVKILLKNKLTSSVNMENILNEVRILQMLDHPNILRVFECYQDKFCYCIVTELCTGGELFKKISDGKGISEEQAAEFIRHIISCVAYLHERRIMHRDLKPENFLLHADGSNMLKLIDFGAACSFEPGQTLSHRIGTSYYIAPEMMSNKYNEKCDLWSVGVILHIMLVGCPPFEGKTDLDILKKIQKAKIDPNSGLYKKLSPRSKDLLFKLLRVDPKLRISAREALNHEWLIHSLVKPVDRASSMSLLENLNSFHPHKNIEKLTLSYITSHLLTSHEIEKMTELFESWDLDQNGTLSKNEFKTGIRQYLNLSEQEIDELFADIDTDSSGEIYFSEFVTACCVKDGLMNREILGIVFNEYDYDRTGSVDREKLKHIVSGHKSFDDRVWDQIIQEIDDQGRGSFDFEQFYHVLSSR